MVGGDDDDDSDDSNNNSNADNDADGDDDEGYDDRFVEQLLSKLLSFPGPGRSHNCKAFIMFVFSDCLRRKWLRECNRGADPEVQRERERDTERL